MTLNRLLSKLFYRGGSRRRSGSAHQTLSLLSYLQSSIKFRLPIILAKRWLYFFSGFLNLLKTIARNANSKFLIQGELETNTAHFFAFPSIKIASGSLEFLKWLGMIFMTLDHTNRFLFEDNYNFAYNWGRLAMPLFMFVFVYNIASKPFDSSNFTKIVFRSILFGLLATPAYRAMLNVSGIFPLNIIFAFLIIGVLIHLIEEKQMGLSLFVFLMAGYLVDYSWPGLFFGISCWLLCRQPCWLFLLLSLFACSALYLINHNNWALLAIPIIFFITQITIKIPRFRYIFWIYYPMHLTVLWLIKLVYF